MGDFFKSIHFKILMSLFVLLLAFMLRAAWTGGLSPMLSQAVGLVVTPLQKVSATISDSVGGFFHRYAQADEIAQENEDLRAEVSSLREQMVDYEQYKRQSEDLKKYIGIKDEHPDFELEPAAVVARDPNDRFYSVTIDKGSLQGVSLRDPVISSDGLVGVVQEVGANYSKVVTILDVSVDVGAYVTRTRDIGIVNGAIGLAAEGQCKLTYLPRESIVSEGDLVATSGGSIFPKDLVIGKISKILHEESEISLYAVITPAADIRKLTDVVVIKSFSVQEEAVEATDNG